MVIKYKKGQRRTNIMTKRLQGLIVGIMIGTMLTSGIVFAAGGSKTFEAVFNNIKIVIDGTEIVPKDASGNVVEPFIANGTTYLPVRAVAEALGKEVYWDGPNYTVYLGSMGGALEYPTLGLEDAVNIGDEWLNAEPDRLTDNYENRYAKAIYPAWGNTFETLLNMKYSRFKATVYVIKGWNENEPASFSIETDGKIVYNSPEINKTSAPFAVDVSVKGCNNFKIIPQGGNLYWVQFANAGFYQ
jgi:hypothetical protein